jgi:hypothetical protein
VLIAESAQVAGGGGCPFVASYHITSTALEAIDAYRNADVPSATPKRPYVEVSADIVVADDTGTARQLAISYAHWAYSIRAGGGAIPYPDPDECVPLTDEQLAVVSTGPQHNRGPGADLTLVLLRPADFNHANFDDSECSPPARPSAAAKPAGAPKPKAQRRISRERRMNCAH